MTNADARLIFLHIPKTAGQSVHSELARIVPDDQVSPVRVHTQVKRDDAQMPSGFRLYSGHLDWDELETVPHPRFAFTVLRDPFERIASFYFYLRNKASNLSAEDLAKPYNTGLRVLHTSSAEDYFFGGDKSWQRFIRDHYDNVQATYLGTRRIRGWAQVRSLSQDALLDAALANADQLDGLYTTDRLDKLEDDLERVLGVRPRIADTRVNVGPGHGGQRWPALADLLGPQASARLARYAEADARLLKAMSERA